MNRIPMRLDVEELQVTTFSASTTEVNVAQVAAVSEDMHCHVWFSDCASC